MSYKKQHKVTFTLVAESFQKKKKMIQKNPCMFWAWHHDSEAQRNKKRGVPPLYSVPGHPLGSTVKGPNTRLVNPSYWAQTKSNFKFFD